MADISQYLAAIMSAVYGEDVRGSIHDAIEIINDVSEVVLSTGTAISSASSSSTGFFTDSLYLNTNTFELWKCIGTDSWQSQGALKGDDGNGIASITKTGTAGLVDTYTITYDDGDTTTFNVTNGADGQNGSVWYKGTALTGTGSGITGFPGVLNDFYLNSTDGYVYNCTARGSATTATWDYVMTLTGGGGSSVTVVDNLNSTSSTDALSANQGHVLNTNKIENPSTKANGDVLTYNGSGWVAQAPSTGSSTLSGLTDTNISSPANDQVLKYDGTSSKWINAAAPAGGHTMIDNTTLINSMNAAITEGTSNDDVVSAYGVGKWSNVDAINLVVQLSEGDDGVGTWEDDDTWESGSRTGWIVHSLLKDVLSDNSVEVSPVFIVPNGKSNAVGAYSMRVDDGITGSLGGVAIKLNAPIDVQTAYVGVQIKRYRVATITVSPYTP